MTGELVMVIVSAEPDQEQNVDSASRRFAVHDAVWAVWAVVADIVLAVRRGQVDMMLPGVVAFVVGEKGSRQRKERDNWPFAAHHKRILHPLRLVVRRVEWEDMGR